MLEMRLVKVCYCAVNIIFGAIMIYLWLLCGFSTCHMSLSEHTYFVKDSFFINMVIAVLFCMLLLFIFREDTIQKKFSKLEKEAFFSKAERVLLFLILIEGLVIILSFRTIPRADQSDVMHAAYALKNGDYAQFKNGGYIPENPNQIGLLWFWYILSFIFGSNNYVVFQFINVIAIVLIYKQLSDISRILELPQICRTCILLFGALYLPVLFYSTFVYGNIIAQMLVLVSLKYEMVFIKKPQLRYALISAVFLSLSIAIKENNLIFAIAMIIYVLLKLLEKKEAKILLFIVCSIAGMIIQGYFLENMLEVKTREQIEGMSMWSFVAMGLHENDTFCDGWWDGSTIATYIESGYNADEQKKTAIADIQNSLEEFNKDKRYALRFFSRKIASQWNNPTFQCFWINQTCGSDVVHPKWVNEVLSVKYEEKITRVLDIVQFLILTGVILSILLSKENEEYILLKVIFIGGFLFHIVWEAKTQYALPYFLLMLPISLNGYYSLVMCRQKCASNENIVDLKEKRNRLKIYALGGLILLTVIMDSQFANNPIRLDFDADLYEQYLYNNTSDKIKDGRYNIKVYKDPQLLLSCNVPENNAAKADVLTEKFKEGLQGNASVQDIGGRVRIQFADSKYYLDLDMDDERKGLIHACIKNEDVSQDWFMKSASQDWYLKKAEDGQHTYYIIKGDSALAYDEKNASVRLERRDYSDLQKWIIE